MVSSPEGETYGQVLFRTAKTGVLREVYREVDRLHARAGKYLSELRERANERARAKRAKKPATYSPRRFPSGR